MDAKRKIWVVLLADERDRTGGLALNFLYLKRRVFSVF